MRLISGEPNGARAQHPRGIFHPSWRIAGKRVLIAVNSKGNAVLAPVPDDLDLFDAIALLAEWLDRKDPLPPLRLVTEAPAASLQTVPSIPPELAVTRAAAMVYWGTRGRRTKIPPPRRQPSPRLLPPPGPPAVD